MSERIKYEYNGEDYLNFEPRDMVLQPNDPEREYESIIDQHKVKLHWGQRKLGIALIQFLTLYWDPEKVKNPVVVYAGAAPGVNISIVSKLFPQITWELYDPASFQITQTEKIHLHNEIFTDEIASQWSSENGNDNVFFVSDIRRSFEKDSSVTINVEKRIWEDMVMQSNWYKIIKPIKGQLKFRLPYYDEKLKNVFGKYVQYLSGTVYKGIWAPVSSTECRLVPNTIDTSSSNDKNFKEKYWDIKKYESQMFYFNNNIRGKQKYINPYYANYLNDQEHREYAFTSIDPPELLNDYDSLAETNVWILYLKKMYGRDHATLDNIKQLQKFLTLGLNSRGTKPLSLEYSRLVTRVKGIKKKRKLYEKKIKKETDFMELNKYNSYLNDTNIYNIDAMNNYDFVKKIIEGITNNDPNATTFYQKYLG